MSEMEPGPCETCGVDLGIHTAKQLRACTANEPDDKPARRQRKTSPRNGRTIVQALLEEGWKELDTIVELIMSEGEDPGMSVDGALRRGELRGQCQGIAYMLAVLVNPYAPDVEAIREEAMRRWEKGEG